MAKRRRECSNVKNWWKKGRNGNYEEMKRVEERTIKRKKGRIKW